LFCAPRLIFGGTEGVPLRFHVLRARTHFRWYRGRQVPFSCFALADSFSAVPRESCPVFMFCAPGLIFGCAECVGSRFHLLCSRTHLRRYQWRRVPFSCFALPDTFFSGTECVGSRLHVLRPRLTFGGTSCVGSRYLILRSRTRFRRLRGRRVPFSCFTRLDSFSAVPRASGLVSLFCAPGLVFGGTEGILSCFHVLCSRTRFRLFRVRRVPFSCLVLPDSFTAVPMA
jgi:hypothetical protein